MQKFYINIRQTLTHWRALDHSLLEGFPKDMAEWNEDRGSKLDALARVLKHHLASDNASPLKINPNGSIVIDDAVAMEERIGIASKKPDKIVVYSFFTHLHPMIKRVSTSAVYQNRRLTVLLQRLALDGIKTVDINGGMSNAERAKVLDAFRRGGREDARVLILSIVGLQGLNIADANILVIFDALWSAQEDKQLIGRCHRKLQVKLVEVYRIVADKTTDILLNNIAFDKEVVFQAFTGASEGLSKFPL